MKGRLFYIYIDESSGYSLFFHFQSVYSVYFPEHLCCDDETSSTKSEEHHKNTPRLKRVSELNYAHANNKNNDTRHKQQTTKPFRHNNLNLKSRASIKEEIHS